MDPSGRGGNDAAATRIQAAQRSYMARLALDKMLHDAPPTGDDEDEAPTADEVHAERRTEATDGSPSSSRSASQRRPGHNPSTAAPNQSMRMRELQVLLVDHNEMLLAVLKRALDAMRR